MGTTGIAKRAVAVVIAAVIATFAFAGSAFAATVHGADSQGTGSALESGSVDVLNVDGTAGETVFLTVKNGATTLAQNLPYTIGSDANGDDKAEWAGIATLDIAGLDLNALDGNYTVEAYADRAGNKPLYNGALYGVYADLPDGTSKLIGTRVINESEVASRIFHPVDSLFVDNSTYRLVDKVGAQPLGALHFTYEAYDESTTVDGVIKYVDGAGNVLATKKVPGLKNGESREEAIPSAVKADNGDLYRTVYFSDKVKLENPGITSYSIYCTKMSEAAQTLSGFYLATIQMVESGTGKLIASDSVNVTGGFYYTAPSVIYKTEALESGDPAVITYRLKSDPVQLLNPGDEGVVDRNKTITYEYVADPLDSTDVTVTYNLFDGSKRVKEDGRALGTKKVTVNNDNPVAQPESMIEVNGTTYYLSGDPSDYEYTFRSGKLPTVDVYYTPEGYRAPDPYDVTVNYVNFSTNETIESHTYASDADANARITIETPAEFSSNGVDYVRLTGQEDAIAHSFYSGVATYTVYYRDVNDTLAADVVISRIRVEYEDAGAGVAAANDANNVTTTTTVEGGTTEGTTEGATEGTTTDEGTTAADGTTTGADAAAAAAAGGATGLQLGVEGAYNVLGGIGNATLTNASGVDSNTERIEDSETPLASGFDKGATSSAASSFTQMSGILIPLGIAVVIAIVAVVILTIIRRRMNSDEYEG